MSLQDLILLVGGINLLLCLMLWLRLGAVHRELVKLRRKRIYPTGTQHKRGRPRKNRELPL